MRVSAGPLVFIDPDRHPDPGPWGFGNLSTYFYATKISWKDTECTYSPGTSDGVYNRKVVGIEAWEGHTGTEALNGTPGLIHVATTGSYVFGTEPCVSTDTRSWWLEDELVLKFSKRAYSVQADIIFDHISDAQAGRRGVLKAYDSCGRLLQAVYADGDARAPVSHRQAGVYYATSSPIAKVTIGGADGGWVQVDNIQVHFSDKTPACVR